MSKADRHLALRESLIAIAQATVATHGLAGLKAREVARAAGCALGAIYLVFPDLDALILAVNDRTLSAIDAAICASLDCEDAAPSETDPGRQLVVLSCAYLDYALAHPRLWAALFNHTLSPGESVPDEYRAHQAHLFSYVEAPLSVLCPALMLPNAPWLREPCFRPCTGSSPWASTRSSARFLCRICATNLLTLFKSPPRGCATRACNQRATAPEPAPVPVGNNP